MADLKIDDMDPASAVTGAMQFEVDTGGTVAEKVTASQILTYTAGVISASATAPTAANPTLDPATGKANIILQTGTPPKLWLGVSATEWASVDLTVFSVPSILLTNLGFWYKFNNNLTDSSANNIALTKQGAGTVSYVPTTLDNAVDLSSQTYGLSLTHASTDNGHLGFYLAMIVKYAFYDGGIQWLFTQGSGGGSPGKFELSQSDGESGNRLVLKAYDGGSNAGTRSLSSSPATGTSYLIEAYYSPALGGTGNGQIGLAINNGAFVTTDLGSPVSTGAMPITLGYLRLSNADLLPVTGEIFRGGIDLAALWTVPFADLSPTGPERLLLWNGGSFRANP